MADPSNNQVVWFDANGALIGTWSVAEGPIDTAANATEMTIYVSLRDLGIVAVYGKSFDRTGYLGEGDPMVSLVGPTDIGVATDTGIAYLVDAKGGAAYVFTATDRWR